MFGSNWGFSRSKKGEQPQPPQGRESLSSSMTEDPGRNSSSHNNHNSCPDESFDVGNDTTIFISKKELGEFGKLGPGKLAGKVEIYDSHDDDDQRSLTVSPPSSTTTASSTATTNTESHRFWMNCLKENGVLDLSMSGGGSSGGVTSYATGTGSSPAHLCYLAAIRSPGGCMSVSNYHNNQVANSPPTPKDYYAELSQGIFVTSRRGDDLAMLPLNETEETDSILSSKLSYSPSSIGVAAAVDHTLAEVEAQCDKITLSRPGCILTECLQGPIYDDNDDDMDRLSLCHPPSEDSLAIKPLPSDITLKTKITANTEESDDYTDGCDKKISSSGSLSTNTTPCSLNELSPNTLEHASFKDESSRDGQHAECSERDAPELNAPRMDDTESSPIEEEDRSHKLGDKCLASTASAAAVEDTNGEFDLGKDQHVTLFEVEKDESVVVENEGEDFEWAYNVWKSKGLMKTTSRPFHSVKDWRSSGSYNVGSANKSVDLDKQTIESPGEELLDPESLVTPTDSQITFDFQEFEDDTPEPEPASLKGARRQRLSFPLTSRPSEKKLHDGKSFANVMQMWKQKSDDKPNSHFLSPEQNIPASDYKALSAEQKRVAVNKGGVFDRQDVVRMRYHNKATQHATLVSVTSMVSTVSSQLTGATSCYEADHPLKLNESDCHSVFSMSDNRSFMTSESSRDGTESGSVTLRYLRPNRGIREQPVQRRSPPVRGSSIDEQLMMPLPRRMSSGGRSASRRASAQRRRLSDTMIPRGQSGESSDFTKATSPRDHFRRNKSPPKSRGDYKTVVQTFLGQVNDQRDDASNTSHTPPREPRTNCSRMPPLPKSSGKKEEARLESMQPVTASATTMDSRQVQQRPYCYDLAQNQSCESTTSFGGGSFSWRFDSLSQNQSSESAFESNKFPFALDVVDEQTQSDGPMIKNRHQACDFPAEQSQRTDATTGYSRFDRRRGPVIMEESGEESGFDADTSMSPEAYTGGRKSPMPPLPHHRVTPRAVQSLTKSAPITGSIPDDSPWTKHILQNLEDSHGDEKHISPREDSKERPWRSDLVFERACQIGDKPMMSESTDDGKCNCATSVFSGNDELIEFFLPQMGMACTCGNRSSGLANTTEPTSLENILRPWQVLFLAGFGIHRGDQLVKAFHRSANALASALRQYRRKQDMTPFRTKSCGMALQIWAKTCKAYVRSIRKQLTAGTTELKAPNTLYILSSFLEQMQTQSVAAPTPLPPAASTTASRSDEGGCYDPVQAEI